MKSSTLSLQAELLQAKDLPINEARSVIESALSHWPDVWAEILDAIDGVSRMSSPEGPNTSASLTGRFCDTLIDCGASTARWFAVAERLATRPSPRQCAFIACVVKRAEPGDAHVIGDISLTGDLPDESRLLLGQWLLKLGSAELRSSRHTMTGLRLAAFFASRGDVEAAKRALWLGLENERTWALGRDDARRLADALEVVMVGGSENAILEGVIEKLGSSGPIALISTLSESTPAWGWTERVQEVLVGSRLRGNTQTPWWFAVMTAAPPTIDRIPPSCFTSAARALSLLAQGYDFSMQPMSPPLAEGQLRGWATLLASAFASRPELGLPLADLKMALARRQDVREGAREGFLATLAAGADDELSEEANGIFRRSSGLGAHHALIHLLIHQDQQPTQASARDDLDAIVRELHRLVASSWPGVVGGLDLRPVTSWIRSISIEKLDEGSPIAERGSTLVISRDPVEALLDLPVSHRARTALVELFVIHELVHWQQGVSEKSSVTTIRGRGLAGETTLMHLDLGADHVAACALAHAKYPGELLWLKELQAESLQAFPVGSQHGYGSRFRKALRMVGLRADLAARRVGRLGEATHDGSYAFCDIGAGTVSCFQSGPPMRLVATMTVELEDQALLENAAGRPADARQLDAILARLVAI